MTSIIGLLNAFVYGYTGDVKETIMKTFRRSNSLYSEQDLSSSEVQNQEYFTGEINESFAT